MGLEWIGGDGTHGKYPILLETNINDMKKKEINWNVENNIVQNLRQHYAKEQKMIQCLETSLLLIQKDVFVSR